MTTVRTDLGDLKESARRLRFEKSTSVTSTSVQEAIEELVASLLPINRTRRVVTGDFTVLPTDDIIILAKESPSSTAATLSSSASMAGREVDVYDATGNAGTVTFTPNGSETVNGLSSFTGTSAGVAGGGVAFHVTPVSARADTIVRTQ